MRACGVFLVGGGEAGGGLWVQRRFEAGLRATDIVKNEGSEMRLRWRGAETFKKKDFFLSFFSMVLFKEV